MQPLLSCGGVELQITAMLWPGQRLTWQPHIQPLQPTTRTLPIHNTCPPTRPPTHPAVRHWRSTHLNSRTTLSRACRSMPPSIEVHLCPSVSICGAQQAGEGRAAASRWAVVRLMVA